MTKEKEEEPGEYKEYEEYEKEMEKQRRKAPLLGYLKSTWICDKCGFTEKMTYPQILIAGIPICHNCESVMECESSEEFDDEEWFQD